MSNLIKVMVVDDHHIVHVGIKNMLINERDIKLVEGVYEGHEALEKVRMHHPDVILMDVKMPKSSGLMITQRILDYDPAIKILIITSYADEISSNQVLQIGASGFLTKDTEKEEVIIAIRSVHAGQRYISPIITKKFTLVPENRFKDSPFKSLAKRELEVLLDIARGLKPTLIAKKLQIHSKTINTLRYRIFKKLGVTTNVEMALKAIRDGVVKIDNSDTNKKEDDKTEV